MSPDLVSDPGPLALESDALPISLCGPAHDYMNRCYYQLWDGEGWEYAQQTAKYTFDTKKIYMRVEARPTLDQVQVQPTPSPYHCDLEHIHRIPSTKLCVRVCVIFILIVVFHKLRFIKDMGGIMLKEALFLFVCFLSFFRFS